MNPDHVVSAALGALGSGRGCVPGLFNRLTTWLVALLPRTMALRMIAAQTEEVCYQATVSLIRPSTALHGAAHSLVRGAPCPSTSSIPTSSTTCAMKCLGLPKPAMFDAFADAMDGQLPRHPRPHPALALQHRRRRDDPDEALLRVDPRIHHDLGHAHRLRGPLRAPPRRLLGHGDRRRDLVLRRGRVREAHLQAGRSHLRRPRPGVRR